MKTPSEPRARLTTPGQSNSYEEPNLPQLRAGDPPRGRRGKSQAREGKHPARRTSAPPSKTPLRGREGKPQPLRLPLLDSNVSSPKLGCAECGLCCTYVAIEIDAPSTVKRATELLWYLYHEGVSLYVNDDDWMVQFESRCRFLTDDRRCGIYATRPHICREFSSDDCEINTGDDGHTFFTPAAFMEHLKETRPRVHRLVAQGFAPPVESRRGLQPFQRRMRDVYSRRAAALAEPRRRTSSPA